MYTANCIALDRLNIFASLLEAALHDRQASVSQSGQPCCLSHRRHHCSSNELRPNLAKAKLIMSCLFPHKKRPAHMCSIPSSITSRFEAIAIDNMSSQGLTRAWLLIITQACSAYIVASIISKSITLTATVRKDTALSCKLMVKLIPEG